MEVCKSGFLKHFLTKVSGALSFAQKRLLRILSIGLVALASCTSVPNITRQSSAPPTIDSNRAAINRVVDWLDGASIAARDLYAEGELTAANEETSQDAHFVLKSKRLTNQSSKRFAIRIDSLSVDVSGPFGISVARFLASPEEYYFRNLLSGDNLHGKTDAHSLESLIQMKGITLGMLDDALYGLAPGVDISSPQDSVQFFSSGAENHILLIRRYLEHVTEAIYFHGSFEAMAPSEIAVTRYARWNTIVASLTANTPKPDVTIRYDSPVLHDGIWLPTTITAQTGENSLTIDYSKIRANSGNLVVKTKL